MIKKQSWWLYGLVTIIVCFLSMIFFSYYIMNKFISRKIQSEKWHAKNEMIHNQLIKEYNAQPVTFNAADGTPLSGLLLMRPHAQRLFLLCHGFRRSKEHMFAFVRMFPFDSICMFDFRAHGASKGDHCSFGYYEAYDIVGALDYCKTVTMINRLPIIAIGVSMGSMALLNALSHQKIKVNGLVIDSCVGRLDKHIEDTFTQRTGLPRIPFLMIMQQWFKHILHFSPAVLDPLKYAQGIHVPTLIVHSRSDAISPVDDAYALLQAFASKQKALWVVEHSAHARIAHDYTQEYAQRVNEFF